ncbi:hypothetical protein Taro_035701 [Colocasia esculenta]|uniref:Uncharacterized protein n=1 Tax=Colocasia esculenta TaxID=4460 RepID=A0A843WB94_COLES|nr:hypothetical protein [Colocasia esculenta]
MLDRRTHGSETTLNGPTRTGSRGTVTTQIVHRALGQALKCRNTGGRLVRHSARKSAQASRALPSQSEPTWVGPTTTWLDKMATNPRPAHRHRWNDNTRKTA